MIRRVGLTTILMWFGLLGPAFAWTLQHVAGIGITQGICGVAAGPGTYHHLDLWSIVVAAGGLIVGLAGFAAAFATWRRTKDAGTDPPGARIHFLAVVALTTTPLFLAIMVLSGMSALFLTGCTQS